MTRPTSGGQQRGGTSELPDWMRWITWPTADDQQTNAK